MASAPFAFSADGRSLLTGSYGGELWLWDVASRRLEGVLRGTSGEAALSPDSRTLAATSAGGVTLYPLTAQQEAGTFTSRGGPVSVAAFSPDGNTLAAGGADGTVRLWQAASFREADPLHVTASAGDRKVVLQWHPLPWALGCRIDRHPAGALPAKFARLTPQPVAGSSFTDSDPSLLNDRPQIYGVTPLYRDSVGRLLEAPRVMVEATPVAAPPGFLGCSIHESPHTGSVRFDARTGEIALTGSGGDIWNAADEGYLVSQPVTGDFQATVTALARPTRSDIWAKAGLMIRELLGPEARNVYLAPSAAKGLDLQWRFSTNGESNGAIPPLIPDAALGMPITLRLTRQGDTVRAAYSRDQGRSFQPAGEPLTFVEPLAATVYVGLAITAHNSSRISEARFRDLDIQPVRGAR